MAHKPMQGRKKPSMANSRKRILMGTKAATAAEKRSQRINAGRHKKTVHRNQTTAEVIAEMKAKEEAEKKENEKKEAEKKEDASSSSSSSAAPAEANTSEAKTSEAKAVAGVKKGNDKKSTATISTPPAKSSIPHLSVAEVLGKTLNRKAKKKGFSLTKAENKQLALARKEEKRITIIREREMALAAEKERKKKAGLLNDEEEESGKSSKKGDLNSNSMDIEEARKIAAAQKAAREQAKKGGKKNGQPRLLDENSGDEDMLVSEMQMKNAKKNANGDSEDDDNSEEDIDSETERQNFKALLEKQKLLKAKRSSNKSAKNKAKNEFHQPGISYKPSDKILLVGEGNFSFARSLVEHFGIYENLIATCYDDKRTLLEKYGDAKENIRFLKDHGVQVCAGERG
jgi:hypothetical protein